MKLIIAGSRDFHDYGVLLFAVRAYADAGNLWPSEVVSGAATGVDALGERWASSVGFPVKRFPADWGKYGRSAGPRRNKEMSLYADGLLALWNGSPGTKNMISCMHALKKPVFVYRTDQVAL